MNARTIFASFAVSCAFPLLAGCVVDAQPTTPEQPSIEAIEVDRGEPAQVAAGVVEGKPSRFHPGSSMSYWIWETNHDDWHLRATTVKEPHRFQGRIRPVNGATLEGAKAIRTERSDRMRTDGNDIVFDFTTQGGEDGIDFNLRGNGCVEMDLRIDGKPHPGVIILGKTHQTAENGHFIACP